MTLNDYTNDFLDSSIHPLHSFFHPESIAIIGSSEKAKSVGRTFTNNIIQGGYEGKIYPVNPKRSSIFDLPCYKSVLELPTTVDLAIIITPAQTVRSIISECGIKGIKNVLIISAGFKERGQEGLQLEEELIDEAKKYGIRIIGPNCLGIINPYHNLNATFASTSCLKGSIAFISQSGAMCTAVLDWSIKEKIGFSSFISIGSMADIHFGDLIDYLGSDENTHSILIYMETIGDARSFISSAKEVGLNKPIILIKPGKTSAAAKAAASHTGSLAGSDEVFDAAMHRASVLRVDTIQELFNMALVLSLQPPLKGANVTIITNAGGPAVLATDALISKGGKLTTLSKTLMDELNQILPQAWSHSNPIDILGDSTPETFGKVTAKVVHDQNSDALLIILAPQDMADPINSAKEVIEAIKGIKKPVITSWMGGESVNPGIEILKAAKIPNFRFPDDAAHLFAKMWSHRSDLEDNYITPMPIENESQSEHQHAQIKRRLEQIHQEGRTILTEIEAKEILNILQIPTTESYLAKTSDEAVNYANLIGYPVVLKLNSLTITHKSDVGGVKLNIQSANEVEKAFQDIEKNIIRTYSKDHFQGVSVQPMISLKGIELILGSSIDEQFGPTLLFGHGGKLVEILKDKALTLPPVNSTMAYHLMKKTKIYEALKGVRGDKPVNITKLQEIIVTFSNLITYHPIIKECDINPLLVNDEKIVALDARIILHQDLKNIPKPAIRPYPYTYIKSITVGNISLILRPIKPEDEPLIKKFHQGLSPESVKSRFSKNIELSQRISHAKLSKICAADYEKTIAILAIFQGEVIGIARFIKLSSTSFAIFRAMVTDSMQNKGVGQALLLHLFSIAKMEGIIKLVGTVPKNNQRMLRLVEKMGCNLEEHPKDPDLLRAIYNF